MLTGIILLLLFALICAAIASHSGGNPKAGFILGLLLGPLAPFAIRDHQEDRAPSDEPPVRTTDPED